MSAGGEAPTFAATRITWRTIGDQDLADVGGRKMNQREQVNQIKTDLARHPRFRSKCYVCHTKKSKSGFTFHHIWYIETDKTYSDFANTLEYYTYLKPIIQKEPRRFLYLCSDHHQALERMARWGKNLPRLIRAVKLTQKARRIQSYPQVL